jgi:hypothetical protein
MKDSKKKKMAQPRSSLGTKPSDLVLGKAERRILKI